MSSRIPARGVHHLTLTVTDLERARKFYTEVLGFEVAAELSPARVVLTNDDMLLGLSLPTDPARAPDNDCFNENRVGLDHLSFSVGSRKDLEEAVRILEEYLVNHGEITDLPAFGITVLTFRDPDGIQLELTAPLVQY